ncbi:PatB family C-S lyase [Ruminococcaceae bacterium OttesenSCG-928-I18]|nr:PatB family C-S lyase [Ruminococcaceae bacterium OttesenSCG-928-I18]
MGYDFETWRPREGMASIKYELAKKEGAPKGTLPLTIADMEFKSPPEVIEAVTKIAESGMYGYGAADEEFKKAVVGWMHRRHGWQPKTEEMVMSPGIVGALHSAVRAFTRRGERVLVHMPNYPAIFSVPRKMGRIVLENRLLNRGGRYELDLEDLRAKARLAKMMILCSPHNPCGRVWTREELLQMAEICYENKVVLFVDEIHADIILPGFRQVAYGTLPAKYQTNALIATSASKTFSLGGLSTSCIFLPDTGLRQRFAQQMDLDGQYFVSVMGAVATRAGYENGDAWLDEMLLVLQKNYDILKNYFLSSFPGVVLTPLEGTYLAWADFGPLGYGRQELDARLREKAQFYAAHGEGYGAEREGYLRINLACPTAQLEKMLKKIEETGVES